MLKDGYDRLLWGLLAATLVSLAVVLAGGTGGGGGVMRPSTDKALERELAAQARLELVQRLYAPVQALCASGNHQAALFKLDELARQYPNEAHGRMLRGEVLYRMGAIDEALGSYVEGLKLNGDYVDKRSRLSRRAELQQVADEGLRVIGGRARENPGNRSLAASLKNVHYLRSRLAGGCE